MKNSLLTNSLIFSDVILFVLLFLHCPFSIFIITSLKHTCRPCNKTDTSFANGYEQDRSS